MTQHFYVTNYQKKQESGLQNWHFFTALFMYLLSVLTSETVTASSGKVSYVLFVHRKWLLGLFVFVVFFVIICSQHFQSKLSNISILVTGIMDTKQYLLKAEY